jgi:hypothetical protein
MNTYLTNCKVELIKEAKQSLLDLYGIDSTPFTRKIYFYFFIYNNKKYVYKKALNFVYSNAETYTTALDPVMCHLTKEIEPVRICEFLENYCGNLLPSLLEINDKFLVYEFEAGDPVDSITQLEFNTLRDHVETMSLTPFYNSMTYNLVRGPNGIKLIDLKHFEVKDNKPFFVYLYNKDNGVNLLYVIKDTVIDSILQHLNIDYPASEATLIEY